jgi:hypothetical protein
VKAEVRDDIIKLETYVDAEFKYRKYIDIIANCGGYCLVGQFKEHFEKDGGYYLLKKMESAGLISTELFSNSYKYIKLSTAALKYFYYRDHEKDYSDLPKNRIPVPKNISKPPSEKVIYTSILFFELYHTRKNGIIYLKNNHIQHLENKLKKNYFIEKIKKLKKEIEEYNLSIKIYKKVKDKYKIYSVIDENINKEIKIMENYKDSAKKEIASLEKEIEYVDQLIDKIISLRDISKLIIAFEKGTLHVLSQYVVYPKTSYIQILEDFLKVVKEHNEKSKYQIIINGIDFRLYSIFDSKMMVKRLKDKVKKHIKYNRDQFFIRKIGFDNMKFHYDEKELQQLRKYSDEPILHEKKYLKEKDKKSIGKIISDLEKEFPD